MGEEDIVGGVSSWVREDEISDDMKSNLDRFVERLYERKKVAEGDKERLDDAWRSYRVGIIESCDNAIYDLNKVFGTDYPLSPPKK